MAWYEPPARASEISGLSEREVVRMLNSIDPPPHRKVGKGRYLNMDAFKVYLERRDECPLKTE